MVPDISGGPGASTPFKFLYRPAIVAAYDYYPFGMLMPGRWTSDTGSQCVMVTQTKYVPVKVKTPIAYPGYLLVPGTTGPGNLSVPSSGSGVEFATTEAGQGIKAELTGLTPGVEQQAELDLAMVEGGSYRAVVLEEKVVNGVTVTEELNGVTLTSAGVYTLAFTPASSGGSLVSLLVTANASAAATSVYNNNYWYKVTYVAQNTITQVCNKETDRYRFGFNGQMKSNEIAGVGNHLDFKFRGYDPRLGRFWSRDPLAKMYPWNSPYAFAENDVIRAIDIEGLEKHFVFNKYNQDGFLTETTVGTVTTDKSMKNKMDFQTTWFHNGETTNLTGSNVAVVSIKGSDITVATKPELSNRESRILSSAPTTQTRVDNTGFEAFNGEIKSTVNAPAEAYTNIHTYAYKNHEVAFNKKIKLSTDYVAWQVFMMLDFSNEMLDAKNGSVAIESINIYYKDEATKSKYHSGVIDKLTKSRVADGDVFRAATINGIVAPDRTDKVQSKNPGSSNAISADINVVPRN